jgi:hypothetical protein
MGDVNTTQRVVASVILIVASVNPLVEKLDSTSAVVFMFTHYSLFAAGILLGGILFLARRGLWAAGAAIAVLWHVPQLFALSAGSDTFRALEELTMILGGLLVGLGARAASVKTRLLLVALWVAGDTALSILFIADPYVYSNVVIGYSPYPPEAFPPTGIAMVLFMNIVVAYLVYVYVKRINSRLLKSHVGASANGGAKAQHAVGQPEA